MSKQRQRTKPSSSPLAVGFFIAVLSMGGCKREVADAPGARPGEPAPRQPDKEPAPRPLPPDEDALPAVDPARLPPERRAIQVVHGEERVVDVAAALDKGLVVVDLTDEWAPSLFAHKQDKDGKPLINRYRATFVGLANDRTDGDGRALPKGAKNYLELFGIPPSLSVVRARFLDDAGRDCSEVDKDKLAAVDYIPTHGERTEVEEARKQATRVAKLDKAMQQAAVATWEELAAQEPKLEREVRAARRYEAAQAAFAEVEKRMICEGRLDPAKHVAGRYGHAMRTAVVAFQQENMLLDRTDIRAGTLAAVTQSAMQNNMATLRRVLAERAVDAGGIIEDGSVDRMGKGGQRPTYRAKTGEDRPVPNLVDPATDAVLARLGITSGEEALAFFRRHPKEDFQWLKVAVRFPTLPDYYAEHMDLETEIDRGDIWYELPYDQDGKRLPQPRRIYPSLTVFVKWNGQRVPLVRWRTTIGGWRGEMAPDGHDYLRYKGSDVGKRVWRHIVAAPVWIPPESTPLGGMVRREYVNGARQWVTNYDEVGPGYTSAYGLGMAIHVEMRKHRDGAVTYFDNGIRAHGSSDYRSLLGRFSHGCHRLYNNLAVRMLGFVLRHRQHSVVGSVQLDFRRRFLAQDRVFEMRLPVRGFYYELTPPVPVEVLEGNIKGELKKPIEGYVMKPGVQYPTSKPPPLTGGPESRAGESGGDV